MVLLYCNRQDLKLIAAGVSHEPVGNPNGPGLWHHKGMQLPAYIQHIANDLRESGMDTSRAIATAVSRCKVWCAGGGNVKPETKAKACDAIAEWEKLKTRASAFGAAWDAALHPRAPAGGPAGGQFAPASTSAAPTNEKPVGEGEKGKRVSDLQKRLNQLGFKLKVDGQFGEATKAAVRAFQKARGLVVDGLVGPKTTAALRGKAPAGKKGPGRTARKVPRKRTTMASDAGLVTIPDVDLMAAGTWKLASGRQTFTRKDITDAIEAAKCPAVGNPVIKIGHNDQRFVPQDGEPALGTITNMRPDASGVKLRGDLTDVPSWLADISASAFPRRSIEGSYDFTCQIGHKHPFVVSALALLGLTRPGVGVLSDLKDLRTLYGPQSAKTSTVAAERPWSVTYQEGEAVVPVTEEDVRRAYYAGAGIPQTWWITELQMNPSQLVVSDGDGVIYQVPFEIEGEDAISFGEARELADYAEVAASRASGEPLFVYASAEESRDISDEDEDGADDEADDEDVADVTAADAASNCSPDHGPTTGSHSHAHPAYGAQGGDATHQHAHSHQGDAMHQHAHANAGAGQEEGVDVEFTDGQLASLRASIGLADDEEVTAEHVLQGFGKVRASAGRVPKGVIQIDQERWDDMGRRVKAAEDYQRRQQIAERDTVIDQAVRDGKFSAARKPHYARVWDADPDGAREIIAGLQKGVVPVSDIGSPGGQNGFDDELLEDEYKSLFPPGTAH